MKQSSIGRWVMRHRAQAYVIVPLVLSTLLMALYFSGSQTLQQLVAPTIEGLSFYNWREFGILEMLQNLVLIGTIACLVRCGKRADRAQLSALCYALAAGFLFVFLEEVDYGMHFLEYFGWIDSNLQPDSWSRNLHNRSTSSGAQYGSYMKTAATVTLAVGFLIAPFVLRNSRFPMVRLFTPTRWAAATVVLIAVLSRVAHLLDNAGLSQIDGTPGNLEYNISEFRELNMYYLFLLYFTELHQRLSEPIRNRSKRS